MAGQASVRLHANVPHGSRQFRARRGPIGQLIAAHRAQPGRIVAFSPRVIRSECLPQDIPHPLCSACRHHPGAAMTTPPSEIVFLVEDAPEGGYQAQALGHAIYTAADDAQTLKANVRDAVRCHFEDPQRPGLIRLHYVRDEVIAA